MRKLILSVMPLVLICASAKGQVLSGTSAFSGKVNAGTRSWNLIFDGNSLTSGTGASAGQDYPNQTLTLINIGVAGFNNFAVSGQTTPQMESDAATQIDPLFNAGYHLNALLAWEVTNDLVVNGANGATAYSNFKTYCQHRKDAHAGMVIIIFGVLPRNTGVAGFETNRGIVNVDFRADFSGATSDPKIFTATSGVTYADYFVDLGADTRIGDLGDNLDTTYYNADGIHMNNAGYAIVASYAKTALTFVP